MEAREGGAEKVVSPIPVFLIAFVAIMGGALLGITLRRFLPGHHLAEDSKTSSDWALALSERWLPSSSDC